MASAGRISGAQGNLRQAIRLYDEGKLEEDLAFLTLAKAFEVLVEYAWKELKRKVEDEGLDAASPKEAVRQAARLKMIEGPEKWIDCINARNDSVHDYFGIPREDYLSLAKEFLILAERVD